MQSAGSYEQTAFKQHVPGSLVASRNQPHECNHCQITKPPGAPAFPICSGCKMVRYCSRDHQIAHWKDHKLFCKSQKHFNENTLQSVRASSEMAPSGITVKEKMMLQEDDFCRLHMWSLRVAVVCCIHENRFLFHFTKRYMRIGLKYLPDGDGNPAKTFTIEYVCSDQMPDKNRPLNAGDLKRAQDFDVQFSIMGKQYEDQIGTPGYKGLVMCTYDVKGLPCSSFPMPIHEYEAVRDGPVVTGWYERMKSLVDNGIVHRFLDGRWKPGVMVKKGTKWIFKERSREELLTDFGVVVPY